MSRHQKAHRLDVLDEKPAVWNYLWVKRAVKKPLRGKVQQRDFPTPLGNPATAAGFRTFPTAPTTAGLSNSCS